MVSFRRARPAALACLAPFICLGEAAASMQNNSQPAWNVTGCGTWPTCTARCERCDQTLPYDTCLFPLRVPDVCGANARCVSKVCFCSEGFCHTAEGCVKRKCLPGDLPPVYKPTDFAKFLATLGPELPEEASAADWKTYALHTSLRLPLIVMLLGLLVACWAGCFLCFTVKELDFSFLPKTPGLLLGVAGVTIILILFGMVVRHVVLLEAFEIGMGQLTHVKDNFRQVTRTGQSLNKTVSDFSEAVLSLPKSCDYTVRDTVMNAVKTAKGKVELVTNATRDFNYQLGNLDEKIDMVENLSGTVQLVWFLFPMLPLLLMLLVSLAIVAAVLVSWCHHDPEVADRADVIMLTHGAGCMVFLIVAAGLLAALFLEAGIISSSFCLHVDENVVAVVGHLSRQQQWGNNQMVRKVAEHYIMGTTENPLVEALDQVDSAIDGLQTLWQRFRFLPKAMEGFCNGLDAVNVKGIAKTVRSDVVSMTHLLHASNIWPYYHHIVQNLLCSTLTRSMALTVPFNMLVGLICFPILALLAHLDLEKWAHWKKESGRGGKSLALEHAKRSFVKVESFEAEDTRTLLSDGDSSRAGSFVLPALPDSQPAAYQTMPPWQTVPQWQIVPPLETTPRWQTFPQWPQWQSPGGSLPGAAAPQTYLGDHLPGVAAPQTYPGPIDEPDYFPANEAYPPFPTARRSQPAALGGPPSYGGPPGPGPWYGGPA